MGRFGIFVAPGLDKRGPPCACPGLRCTGCGARRCLPHRMKAVRHDVDGAGEPEGFFAASPAAGRRAGSRAAPTSAKFGEPCRCQVSENQKPKVGTHLSTRGEVDPFVSIFHSRARGFGRGHVDLSPSMCSFRPGGTCLHIGSRTKSIPSLRASLAAGTKSASPAISTI